MNKLVEGMNKAENKTVTQNGMKIKKSSENVLVDLFHAVGASRGQADKIVGLFQKAYKAEPDVAIRIALYARDVRGGMGERDLFRAMMTDLATQDFTTAKKVVKMIPVVGRWDDVLALVGTPVETEALDLYVQALKEGDMLAHKWAPREKSSKKHLAVKLRDHMFGKASSPKERNALSKKYRKMLSTGTDVVEQKMADGSWKKIEFKHVPSLASSRYQNAFQRHAPSEYEKFANALVKGETTINAGAVYPYDIIKSMKSGQQKVASQQWKALPDYIGNDSSFVPLIDVSGSMGVAAAGSTTAMDIAVSLGIYCAQRNKSAFKDMFLTFTSEPSWVDIGGLSLKEALAKTYRAPWGMSTNLEAAMKRIVEVAVKHDVPKEDMPKSLIVFSDMQFDAAVRNRGAQGMTKKLFEKAGYDVPQVVYWNLRDYGANTPVKFDKDGTALVSGFSPAIMKSVLSLDMDKFTPLNVVLDAVMVDRYNWQ